MNICSKIMLGIWIVTMIILFGAIAYFSQGLITETICNHIIVGCIVFILATNTANFYIQRFINELEKSRLYECKEYENDK